MSLFVKFLTPWALMMTQSTCSSSSWRQFVIVCCHRLGITIGHPSAKLRPARSSWCMHAATPRPFPDPLLLSPSIPFACQTAASATTVIVHRRLPARAIGSKACSPRGITPVLLRQRSGANATARISSRRATPPRATLGKTPRTRIGARGAAVAAPQALPRANFVPPRPFPRLHRPKQSGQALTRRIFRAQEWVRRFSF